MTNYNSIEGVLIVDNKKLPVIRIKNKIKTRIRALKIERLIREQEQCQKNKKT